MLNRKRMAKMGAASGIFALFKALIILLPVYLFIILVGIGILISPETAVVMFFISLAVGGLIRWLCRPLRYLVRAGHLAVVNEIITTGKIPSSPVSHGFAYVRQNFLQVGVFLILDALLMRVIVGMKNMIGGTPGLRRIPFLGRILKKSTKYIDECIMGYIMLTKRSHQPFRAAADGVVIYGVHFLPILKNSVKLVFVDWALSIVFAIIAFIIVGIGVSIGVIGLLICVLIAMTAFQFKMQFMETKIFLSMYKCFLEGAAQTELPHPVQLTIMRAVPSYRQLSVGDLQPLEQQTVLQQQDMMFGGMNQGMNTQSMHNQF